MTSNHALVLACGRWIGPCNKWHDVLRSPTVLSLEPWVLFIPSRRRHTRLVSDWSSDVCSSDLLQRDHRDEHRLERAAIEPPADAELCHRGDQIDTAHEHADAEGRVGQGRETLVEYLGHGNGGGVEDHAATGGGDREDRKHTGEVSAR